MATSDKQQDPAQAGHVHVLPLPVGVVLAREVLRRGGGAGDHPRSVPIGWDAGFF